MYDEQRLRNRLNSFLSIYSITSNKDYPRRMVMLGFGSISFENRIELAGRIKELCDLIGINIEEIMETENNNIKLLKEVIKN